jgi:hypothetical protein
LSPQSIPIAENNHANHIVYADELVCDYITIDPNSIDTIKVYHKLVDPNDQNIYIVPVVTQKGYSSAEELLFELEAVSSRMNLVLLGLQFPSMHVFKRLSSDNDLLRQIENANMRDEIEELLSSVSNKSLQHFIEKGEYEKVKDHEEYRSIPPFQVLNHRSRIGICTSLIDRSLRSEIRDYSTMHENDGHKRVGAPLSCIVMCEHFIESIRI